MLIYKWTNKVNGKVYIGQTTKSLAHRTRMHVNSSNAGSILPLHNAIRKYGIDSFVVEQVCFASNREELNELEVHIIEAHSSLSPNGYNLKMGGHCQVWHPDMKAKASTRARERMAKDQGVQFAAVQEKGRKALMGKDPWNKGKKASDIAKMNQSKSHIGQIAWNKRPIMCIETNQVFDSLKQASLELKVSSSKICLVLKGQRKHTKGYTFKYLKAA